MKKVIFLAIPFLLSAESISFNKALELTLKNNKELKAKKTKIEQAKLDLAKAKGYNFGVLKFNENVSRTNNPLYVFGMKLGAREATFKDFGFSDFMAAIGKAAQASGGDFGKFSQMLAAGQENLLNTAPNDLNNPEARTNYETKFVYEVPLFTGFKLTKAQKMASLQVKANEAKYNYDKKELALEVLKAYNGAVAAKYFISATKKAKEATKSFVFLQLSFKKKG